MKLFEPGRIGSLKLKNRVVMSPMNVGGNNESDGCLSSRGIDYFVERAKGGVGMIVTGSVRVTREFERDSKTIPLWMLFADHMIHAKWISELSERCHDYGTKVCVQITCGGGRMAGAYAQNIGIAIGPSEIPCFYPPHKNTRALTQEEIKKFLTSIEDAARLIKNAGADAIQIHGHQGYLIDQFSTSLWNHRTDDYGGSLENRLRFAKEMIEAIKKGAGEHFPVIYRYGLSHFVEGGRTIEEGLEMAKLLESYGADALDIDSGCYENNYLPHPPETIPCGSFAYLAEKVKHVVSIPVISSTRIGYPEIAEDILETGKADFVSLGRPLIADPFWCEKAESGALVRPCIACHEGCLRRLVIYKPLSCAVNPLAGNEEYLKLEKASIRKNVVVVGGGVAGIVAAITCANRGHEVTLIEKADELGGNFRSYYLPKFKDDYRRYIEYLKHELSKTTTKVILNTNSKDYFTKNEKPDVVVEAVGSSFRKIDIDGKNTKNTVSPFEMFRDVDFSNKKVAIVGGGLIGVEAAINVAVHGGKPVIFEKDAMLARTAYPVNRQHLMVIIKELGIQTFIKTSIISVANNVVRFIHDEQEGTCEYDVITYCVGMKANTLSLDFEPKQLITVGDADKVDNVLNAVWSAYRQCRLI